METRILHPSAYEPCEPWPAWYSPLPLAMAVDAVMRSEAHPQYPNKRALAQGVTRGLFTCAIDSDGVLEIRPTLLASTSRWN